MTLVLYRSKVAKVFRVIPIDPCKSVASAGGACRRQGSAPSRASIADSALPPFKDSSKGLWPGGSSESSDQTLRQPV